jgi:hypothetical protein
LTKARAIRDLAVSAGIPMTIEDTWGGDIVTAAIAHLAHSTPDDYLFCRFVDWLPDASFYVLLLYMVLMSIRMLLLRCYSPPLDISVHVLARTSIRTVQSASRTPQLIVYRDDWLRPLPPVSA